ncbi:MAG: TetR/AcrR family transcriptional regulator [Acidobacteria bacterium]|nr:TetR/AcrR family transcriptional regulator [Acidobacteriota bacterium]
MASRSAQPRLSLRRRVLHAATAEFSSAGFAAARLDSIAAEAGVDLDTIHQLIGGKDELYATVLLDVLAEALALVGPAVAAAPSPEGRLRAAVAGIASVASDNPHFSPLLLREIASGGASLPTPVVAHMQLLFRILAHILSHGAAGGVFRPVDPFVTQMALAGSLLVVIAGAPIVGRLRDADTAAPIPSHLAESISDLLLDGVRPHDKKSRHAAAGAER